MRRYRQFLVVLAATLAAMVVAAAGASASRSHVARVTLKFFGRTTAVKFTDATGQSVGRPAPGDHLFDSVNLYAGTAAHHKSRRSGSAYSYCTIKKIVSQSDVQAGCDSAVAIGGSMVVSISTQNIAASHNVYRIDYGAGKWAKVKGGSVKTTSLGNGKTAILVTIKG